jgi:hypothetical protein
MSYCHIIRIIQKAIEKSFIDHSEKVLEKHIRISLIELYPDLYPKFETYLENEYDNNREKGIKKTRYIHELYIRNYLGYGRADRNAIDYLIEYDIWYLSKEKEE